MVKTKWPPNFYHLKAGPDILASLDRFGIKNILFIALFFIKWSRLATIRNPDFFVRDWHKIEFKSRTFKHGSAFGCLLYSNGIWPPGSVKTMLVV
jgi:hypothetical protein